MNVHRFKDAVAISLTGGGGTRYLAPAHAIIAGRALIAAAESCLREAYLDSPDGLSVDFDSSNGDTWKIAEIDRTAPAKGRITPARAREILAQCPGDFHALRSLQVAALLVEADAAGYRAPRNANGSRGRCFHAYLVRLAARKG